MNTETYPVAQLCVNILLAIKVTLITGGIRFGKLKVKKEEGNLWLGKCRNNKVEYSLAHKNEHKFWRNKQILYCEMENEDFKRNDEK
jgi:hypothetical protein